MDNRTTQNHKIPFVRNIVLDKCGGRTTFESSNNGGVPIRSRMRFDSCRAISQRDLLQSRLAVGMYIQPNGYPSLRAVAAAREAKKRVRVRKSFIRSCSIRLGFTQSYYFSGRCSACRHRVSELAAQAQALQSLVPEWAMMQDENADGAGSDRGRRAAAGTA